MSLTRMYGRGEDGHDWSLISTETSKPPLLQVATSSEPSPLKSPAATPLGFEPTGKLIQGESVPSPWPGSRLRLLEWSFAAATSSLPSPVKSPSTTATEPPPES